MTEPEVEYIEEFYPPTDDPDARTRFCIEIRTSERHSAPGFDLTVWMKSSGNGLGIPIRTVEKARRLAKHWYETLKPEYDAMLATQKRINAERYEIDKVQYAERQAREAEEHAQRMAQITPDTSRVTVYQCPDCEHLDDLEEFEVPSYECATDGPSGRGEDGRRCDVCSKFTAKASDYSCPSCEAPLDEEPEALTGVEIDGRFIPESDLPEEKRAHAGA